jgi:hypothetical protein
MEMNEIMSNERIDKKKVKGFFDRNSVLAPILINDKDRKQAVMVHVNPKKLTAELYYKPNDKFDNSKYSPFKSSISIYV